jgi:hypothetical protein
MPPLEPEDLPFVVEVWDRDDLHVERVLARATNALVARGAYQVAARLYGHRQHVTLRDCTRLIASTRRDGDGELPANVARLPVP